MFRLTHITAVTWCGVNCCGVIARSEAEAISIQLKTNSCCIAILRRLAVANSSSFLRALKNPVILSKKKSG